MLREYVQLPRSIHILCLGSLVNRAGSFVLVFLTIYISEQLGFSKTFAARCMGAFGLGSVIASLIGGQLADQLGRKVVMVTSLFLGAVLLMVLSFATTASGVLLTIVLYALVAETFRPACSAMMGDLTRPEQRPAAFSLYYIAINLGFACGPPIGGVLADYSYNLLFWADAATMAVFGLILLVMIPETLGMNDTKDTTTAAEVPVKVAIKRIWSDKAFLLFCVASFLMGLVFTQGFATLPIFIKNAGYTNREFGTFMAVNGFLIFVCQLPLTHYLERYTAMGNMVVGTGILAIGFGMYVLPVSNTLLVMAVIMWTVGEMVQAPFKHTVVTNLAPTELRARYMGTISMCFAVALMLGSPAGGEILERYGSDALWITSFCVGIIATAVYASVYRSINLRSPVVERSAAAR